VKQREQQLLRATASKPFVLDEHFGESDSDVRSLPLVVAAASSFVRLSPPR
jgi:hypothetical protein